MDLKTNPKKENEEKDNNMDENVVQKYYNREVWFVTTSTSKSKIESRMKQLEKISLHIIANPDLGHEEREVHKYLCDILRNLGCDVHSSYIHPTAFKAVYPKEVSDLFTEEEKKGKDAKLKKDTKESKASPPPTVGLICEYDAIKRFGFANGNNLSTEAAIGALIGVREAMKCDTRLVGKIVVLGTPASEQKGGKVMMIRDNAFDKIDVIIAVTPSHQNCLVPKFYCSQTIKVSFLGISCHMEHKNGFNGQNTTDAAVLCYRNAMVLSNQVQPKCLIHCVINSSKIDYLVPKKVDVVFSVRAPLLEDLDFINGRIIDCCESASQATHTKVEFLFPNDQMYSYVNHNIVLANAFKEETNKLGIDFKSSIGSHQMYYRTTDLGNVSFKVPLIKPSFCVASDSNRPLVHTKGFTKEVSKPEAQTNTINLSIAMSFTIIKYLLNPKLRQQIKNEFDSQFQELNNKFNQIHSFK